MRLKSFFGILTLLILATGLWTAWGLFGPTLDKKKGNYFYVTTPLDQPALLAKIKEEKWVRSTVWIELLLKFWHVNQVKPGRYSITKGTSTFQFIRALKNNKQAFVKLVINKIRTKEELAGLIGERIDSQVDSSQLITFFNNNDSLQRAGVDTCTLLAIVLPYTYEISWAEHPTQLLTRFAKSWEQYWTDEQRKKAKAIGLSPYQVSTLASIVEEETNYQPDRYKIASTYLNRLRIGMKLQADPTAKYVTRNFKLNRILYGHLTSTSPYNTYTHIGLPPGPICTPSFDALKAVLEAPNTSYLFFVASWKFDGTSLFASSYEEHQRYVKLFHAEQLKRIR